ncbi:methylthioribulose-1-phosphate dehydratase isoform X3 [Molossus molossus]|uniref:methylthioribulose-1-phosphate dehydratase isoform X3 n=1 Tax=Molossus molossus TaxID=27622 RepID=UPI00174676C9|nr:methylthioribulose-1-phosphate dehydratase isoform X3 [Molossus molossus]
MKTRLPDSEDRGCGISFPQVFFPPEMPEDMFVCDINGKDISGPPPCKNLKKSQCTPLFMNAYTLRGAGAVIHTHSKAAVLATLLFPGQEFKITHQEMIKGIRKCTSGGYYRYDDMLVVPIIENTPEEKDLKERMARAMNEYPDSCAVLVRRHGVYVWGETWEKAKTMCECYDYLFDIAVSMKKMNKMKFRSYITQVKCLPMSLSKPSALSCSNNFMSSS